MSEDRARRRRRALAALVAAVGLALVAGAFQLPRWTTRLTSWMRSGVDSAQRPTPVATPAVVAPVTVTSATRVRHVLVADASGRLRIPAADPPPLRLPADGTPRGWLLKEFAGRASVELVQGDREPAIRLRSERTSFVLYRDVLVDLDEMPVLTWAWNVVQLPAGGDVRHPGRNDQAAQIYVVFPRWPAPSIRSDVVGYVWDTTAPVGTQATNAKASNVRVIVVESGSRGLGTWHRHRRNVRDDYLALYGRRPPRVGSVAVMIDADDTGGAAEALVSELAFSRS